ncbi:MAG: hypothetical protein MSC30_19315 [Gaiellaceae bacterium MAG52_C11]|nr:hypothetical protein [Candidatus Gaiellasilicea maunaloa]
MTPIDREDRYLSYLLNAIRASARRPPQLGTGRDVSLEAFRELYGGDPFYSWLGLDSELLYASHRAAAAMTSLYRKLGDGCQELWRAIIRDEFGVDDEAARWSYAIPKESGPATVRKLDGYIDILDFPESPALERFEEWLPAARARVGARASLRGGVFEIRQGYKSQDAKRSGGDVDNAARIALQGCLPVLVVFSTQLPTAIARRYASIGWLILRGDDTEDVLSSTFAFSRDVMGFDLAQLLRTNAAALRAETERSFAPILETQ